jgi:uncharacterized protein (DUF2342 family)
VVGLICNLLIRPVAPKYFMTEDELAEEKRLAHERAAANVVAGAGSTSAAASSPVTLALAWAAVGIPLAWGVWMTLSSVSKFFN